MKGDLGALTALYSGSCFPQPLIPGKVSYHHIIPREKSKTPGEWGGQVHPAATVSYPVHQVLALLAVQTHRHLALWHVEEDVESGVWKELALLEQICAFHPLCILSNIELDRKKKNHIAACEILEIITRDAHQPWQVLLSVHCLAWIQAGGATAFQHITTFAAVPQPGLSRGCCSCCRTSSRLHAFPCAQDSFCCAPNAATVQTAEKGMIIGRAEHHTCLQIPPESKM